MLYESCGDGEYRYCVRLGTAGTAALPTLMVSGVFSSKPQLLEPCELVTLIFHLFKSERSALMGAEKS